MATEGFGISLPFVLRWEGGFVNHRNDPGGPTNRGITQAVYDLWRKRQGLATRSVEQLEDTEMRSIYEAQYWMPPRCDLLMSNLDLVQFDTAVNMGVGRAVRFLQRSIQCEVDGDFGPGTERALSECDQGSTISEYCSLRERFYRGLVDKDAKFAVFLKGWMNRLNALRKEVGLPGFESAAPFSFGDTPYIYNLSEVSEIAGLDR
ncbi:MAG: glycoside hydrolase family 108 protein [Povalibacter sp.]